MAACVQMAHADAANASAGLGAALAEPWVQRFAAVVAFALGMIVHRVVRKRLMAASLRERQETLKAKMKRAAERAVLQAEQVTAALKRLEDAAEAPSQDNGTGKQLPAAGGGNGTGAQRPAVLNEAPDEGGARPSQSSTQRSDE